MPLGLPVVWSDAHRQHAPDGEVWVGVRIPGTELPERAERIRAELEAAGAPVVAAERQPDVRLHAVHDPALIDYLAGAHTAWRDAGLHEEPGQDRVVPYVFPDGSLPVRAPAAASARAGFFAYDTMTLIGPGTWEAARAAVDVALGQQRSAAPRRSALPCPRGAGMTLPLAGVRVLDLTRLLPGPFCSQLLADFGADVVKVEDAGAGDYARWAGPDGAFFAALNRNKRSIRIDLKRPAGRDVLLELVERADVLMESFRPGTLERLELGHATLHARRPELVICPISGFGQEGPDRDRAGHDIGYLAASGVLGVSGDAGAPPALSGVQIADLGGGALLAAFGILAALRHRDATGEGQVVDISMTHGALAWLGPLAAEAAAGRPPRRGELALGGGLLCYRTYATADGRHVALGALEPKFFAVFCAAAGCEHLRERQFDPPGSAAHEELAALFASRPLAHWEALGRAHDCCLEPVRTLEEALDSELVRARGMLVEVDGRTVLGSPVAMSRTPADHHRRGIPGLGEHTDEVLAELGLDAASIAALHEAGAVAGPDPARRGSFLG